MLCSGLGCGAPKLLPGLPENAVHALVGCAGFLFFFLSTMPKIGSATPPLDRPRYPTLRHPAGVFATLYTAGEHNYTRFSRIMQDLSLLRARVSRLCEATTPTRRDGWLLKPPRQYTPSDVQSSFVML